MRTQFGQDREMLSGEAGSPRQAAVAEAEVASVVSLHRQVRGIVAAVVVLSRLATLVMVALSVVGGVQVRGYTSVSLAAAVYAVLVVWSAVLITLVLRRAAVPDWALVVDVAVTSVGTVVLPLAVSDSALSDVANPYLEPITVSVAVAVALVSGSAQYTAAGCTTLAGAYIVGQAPLTDSGTDIVSLVSTIGWQVGIATCCLVFIDAARGGWPTTWTSPPRW